MKPVSHLIAAAAVSTVTVGCAVAQSAPTTTNAPLRAERQLSLDMANRLAADTVAACGANGHSVAATVVDRAGVVRAVQRADNAGPHTIEASRLKAFTSASARNTTLAMMETAQKNPGAANLVHIPGFLLLGGGVPIKLGNEVVGALGVGGAPGGHLDEQCAVAAIERGKDALK